MAHAALEAATAPHPDVDHATPATELAPALTLAGDLLALSAGATEASPAPPLADSPAATEPLAPSDADSHAATPDPLSALPLADSAAATLPMLLLMSPPVTPATALPPDLAYQQVLAA